METTQPYKKRDAEISMRTLLLKLRSWSGYVWKKRLIICIAGAVGAGLGLLYGFLESPKYKADLTLVMEDSQSGNMLGAYAGLASQLGIDLGTGNGSIGVFSGSDNLMAFLRSRLMVEQTLLTTVDVAGKRETLVEVYMNAYHLHEKLDKKPATKGIGFPAGQNRDNFTPRQDSVLNTIQRTIVKKHLDLLKEKGDDFVTIGTTSLDETFSLTFTTRLVDAATQFYINTKLKRAKVNVDKLQASADSLERLLNQKTYAIAGTQDMNLNPARKVASVSSDVQTRDKMVLQTMYAEVVKNLELNKMSMAQETPIIQIIDSPRYPLEKIRIGKLVAMILGGLLGGFLSCFWIIFRRIYKDMIREDEMNVA